MSMKNALKAILIGAGNRGMTVYGEFALSYPEKLNFVAVAEPISQRREKFAKLHSIPEEKCFKSWEDIFLEGKIADIAFICTQDQLHVGPTIKALNLGYNVLLEKPMAHTLEGCVKIAQVAKNSENLLGISHVLRYTNFFSTIHKAIKDGILGEVINITHRENVSYYHMAHSYVRGNWNNVAESSPMILAKCCHDLDLLYYMVGSKPKKISSFGNLKHFKEENAPNGAPEYCVEGCPIQEECVYYAPSIYIDINPIIQIMKNTGKKGLKFLANLRKNHISFLTLLSKIIPTFNRLRYWKEWPVEPLYSGRPEERSEDYTDNVKRRILKTSRYGKCVYKANNDVVDHQLVMIEFENGTTANLTMHGFSDREGRTLRIDGTKATLRGKFYVHDGCEKISVVDHLTGEKKILHSHEMQMNRSGHGGGDFQLIDAFLNSVIERKKEHGLIDALEILESHLMAFAAEESRLSNKVINMDSFRDRMQIL
jgi:predicted dehydrogenase